MTHTVTYRQAKSWQVLDLIFWRLNLYLLKIEKQFEHTALDNRISTSLTAQTCLCEVGCKRDAWVFVPVPSGLPVIRKEDPFRSINRAERRPRSRKDLGQNNMGDYQ